MSEESYLFERDCGVLLHPSSLPNDFGIGDFGPSAIRWIELLAETGQNLWQILPLNPAGYGDSPYQGLSAFAANPYFLSPEEIHGHGLIDGQTLEELRIPPAGRVDYEKVYASKMLLSARMAKAFFDLDPHHPLRREYDVFLGNEMEWLGDFAIFFALKFSFDRKAWTEWPEEFRDRHPEAIQRVERSLSSEIARIKLEQFFLRRQWNAVRAVARDKGIRIIGDLPIFVAHDSADVWCSRDLFRLNPDGSPAVLAGVPPDYFSKTGQLWGNPLYDWERHRADSFSWWRRRLKQTLNWVDVVRIDHFRGFDACWEIPGGAENAMGGQWVSAPGHEVFEKFVQDVGMPLPVIAEDLGVITPEVVALRDRFQLPGIRIEQFAFGSDPMRSSFIPDAYSRNCVAYTGTHDNDTVVGWFNSAAGEGSTRSHEEIELERNRAMVYFGSDGADIHFDFIGALYRSNSGAAIVPLQDVLGLGSEARMNTPGVASGSWRWRVDRIEAILPSMKRLGELTALSKRGTIFGHPARLAS